MVAELLRISPSITIQEQHRTGDHKWWVTDNSKFMARYPTWQVKHSIGETIEEIAAQEVRSFQS